MPDTKLLESPYSRRENYHDGRSGPAQANLEPATPLATISPLPRLRKVRQTLRRIDRYVYFVQLTDLKYRPLPEYVGADLEIVDSCADMRALRTFDNPELAIYFCRVYAETFPDRRFRYRLRRPVRAQCKQRNGLA
jgi:hypothetical protein